MLQIISGTVCAAAFFGAALSWIVCFINLFRTVANRKDGVALFPSWYSNPFNIVFRPRDLTERGLESRRRVFIGFIGFLVFWVIAAGAGILAGLE